MKKTRDRRGSISGYGDIEAVFFTGAAIIVLFVALALFLRANEQHRKEKVQKLIAEYNAKCAVAHKKEKEIRKMIDDLGRAGGPVTLMPMAQSVHVVLVDETDDEFDEKEQEMIPGDPTEFFGRLVGVDDKLRLISVQEFRSDGKGVLAHIPLDQVLYIEEGDLKDEEEEENNGEEASEDEGSSDTKDSETEPTE
jgi:hypothetical protein